MKKSEKILKGKGQADYDYKNDILFFKTINRKYSSSLEAINLVLDLDDENFLIGIQIFEASKYLGFSKKQLLNIKAWQYQARIHEGQIELKLAFTIMDRNKLKNNEKVIINQPSPEYIQETPIMVCEA